MITTYARTMMARGLAVLPDDEGIEGWRDDPFIAPRVYRERRIKNIRISEQDRVKVKIKKGDV